MYHEFPATYHHLIESNDHVVFLETSKFDNENYRSYLFLDPITILSIYNIEEVDALLESIEQYLKDGYYVAGYFAYECGFAFEKIAAFLPSQTQIAFFGIYKRPLIFNHRTGVFENQKTEIPQRAFIPSPFHLITPALEISKEDYLQNIETIITHIKAGNTYQINFTSSYDFDAHGSPLSFYHSLKNKQRVS